MTFAVPVTFKQKVAYFPPTQPIQVSKPPNPTKVVVVKEASNVSNKKISTVNKKVITGISLEDIARNMRGINTQTKSINKSMMVSAALKTSPYYNRPVAQTKPIITLPTVVNNATATQSANQSNAKKLLSHQSNPVYSFFSTAAKDVSGAGKYVQTAVGQGISNDLMGLSNPVGSLSSGLDTLGSKISGGASSLFNKAKSTYSTVSSGFSSTLGGIKNSISKLPASIQSDLSPYISGVESKLSGIGSSIDNGLKNVGSEVYSGLKTAYTDAANGITSAVNRVYGAIKNIPNDLRSLGSDIMSGLHSLWNDFVSFGKWLENEVMQGIKLLENDIMKGLDWVWSNAEKTFLPAVEDIALIGGAALLLFIVMKPKVSSRTNIERAARIASVVA